MEAGPLLPRNKRRINVIPGEGATPGEVHHKIGTALLSSFITHAMDGLQACAPAYTEADIQAAISAYNSDKELSIRAAACAHSIPYHTLRNRVSGRTSRSQAYEPAQTLLTTEEGTLVRWITRLTKTGFPASPALVVEMAEEIC
jgi:hypothetical protein